MPEEHHLTARNLLEQMNRQFNECNALYHELAVHYGVSDTVFWLLYSLYNSSEPQTQCRLFCAVHGFGSFGCQFPPGWRQVQQFAAVTARRGFQFQQSLLDHRSHG